MLLTSDIIVPGRKSTPAMTVSVVAHAAVGLAIAVFVQQQIAKVDDPPVRLDTMVWVPTVKPPSMGGGSPKPAPAPDTPVATVPEPIVVPVVIEEPVGIMPETEALPAAAQVAPGPPTAGASPAARGGTGDGNGTGVGDGQGPGFGGTVYQGGNGVSWPVPTRRPPPQYTAAAMTARLQGEVHLRCIVLPDGTCTDIRVTRSLDSRLGLDEKAVENAKQWRFRPGVRQGTPVPVQIDMVIEFNIR